MHTDVFEDSQAERLLHFSYNSYTGNKNKKTKKKKKEEKKKKEVQLFWHQCFGHKIPTLILLFVFAYVFICSFVLEVSPSRITP